MSLAEQRRATAWVLGGLLLLALLHAWLHASIRPLFQVSDEISYLVALQARATAITEPGTPAYGCIAPPTGEPLPVDPGGKVLFRVAGGHVLASLCRAGVNSTSAFWALRMLNALTLPVMVATTFALGRLLNPESRPVALGAAALVALQPVAATMGGGITPDGLANAASGIALWLASRRVQGGASHWEAIPLAVATIATVVTKDTGAFLLPVAALAAAWPAWVATDGRPYWRVALATAAVVFTGMTIWTVLHFAPPTVLGPAARQYLPAVGSVPTILGLAFGHVASQAWAILWGTWMPLGNFGASTLQLPRSSITLPLAVVGAAVVGLAMLLCSSTTRSGLRRVVWLWWAAITLCVLQPGIREALTNVPDVYQGRWSFPVLPLVAVLAMHGLWRLGVLRARTLPLMLTALLLVASVGLLLVASHYYRSFPDAVEPSHLFLRSSSLLALDQQRLDIWTSRPDFLRLRTPFVWS
ncbi:MAG TPA: hypothetical protein VMF13_08235, partial [Luteitalea sp.]|nr:hypothetical protein [Luteitalea sp.]